MACEKRYRDRIFEAILQKQKRVVMGLDLYIGKSIIEEGDGGSLIFGVPIIGGQIFPLLYFP